MRPKTGYVDLLFYSGGRGKGTRQRFPAVSLGTDSRLKPVNLNPVPTFQYKESFL
jgi:hypothetical protein